MEIKELQEKVEEIVKKCDEKYGCEHDKDVTFKHIVEEIGEVSKEINKPNLKNKEVNLENLKREIADVLILTIHLASNYNINIEDAVNIKIEELKERLNLIRDKS